jgi:hypothetical protein
MTIAQLMDSALALALAQSTAAPPERRRLKFTVIVGGKS